MHVTCREGDTLPPDSAASDRLLALIGRRKPTARTMLNDHHIIDHAQGAGKDRAVDQGRQLAKTKSRQRKLRRNITAEKTRRSRLLIVRRSPHSPTIYHPILPLTLAFFRQSHFGWRALRHRASVAMCLSTGLEDPFLPHFPSPRTSITLSNSGSGVRTKKLVIHVRHPRGCRVIHQAP
jgi:hypothetical protein